MAPAVRAELARRVAGSGGLANRLGSFHSDAFDWNRSGSGSGRAQGHLASACLFVGICFTKYADFNGRASRSEYWWFALAVALGCAILSAIASLPYFIFAMGTVVPSIAAATRRLHDTNRSGWWQLIILVPVVGIIVLLVFLAQESRPATN